MGIREQSVLLPFAQPPQTGISILSAAQESMFDLPRKVSGKKLKTPNHLPNRCQIRIGDAREILREMPANHFDCVVTSPPYWGLRNYGNEKQIGAEETVDAYITDLVQLFREVRRVLAEDGTFWLNIGDSYTSGGRTWRDADVKNKGRAMDYRAPTPEGLKPKDLIGIPWRLAFALQADGWYLRTDIIWNKPNCQPESVKDRPTRSHEYVFLFSKSQKYHYNRQAILNRKPKTAERFGASKQNRTLVVTLQFTHGNSRSCASLRARAKMDGSWTLFSGLEQPELSATPSNGTVSALN
jgi:DNA modification methylase